ncbi:hypothetical protein AX14_010312 [Amanita brunnescens Koide BX004]|nr:hypothetical protein AX14_010312 [Amanita brunnescens Koide BX004]
MPAATATTHPAKPISRKQSHTPSPPPPAQPPSLQTIQLEISLGRPDKYEIDITTLAKAMGQHPPTLSLKFSAWDEESSGDELADVGKGKDRDKDR